MDTPVQISLSNGAWEKRLTSPKHRIYDIDLEGKTAFCTVCGRTKVHVPKTRKRAKPKIFCLNRFREFSEAEKDKRLLKSGHKPRHTLSEIDEETLTAVCSVCGTTKIWKRNYKGSPRYDCAAYRREQQNKYVRARYSTKTTKPNAHGLTEIDEAKKTGVCVICGPVEIYIWKSERKTSRRCSNAPVKDIPGAEKIRRERNTDLINRFKVQNGCKRCGYNSNLLSLTVFSAIGRKKALKIERLLRLNKSQLLQRLESCEVFCTDCWS